MAKLYSSPCCDISGSIHTVCVPHAGGHPESIVFNGLPTSATAILLVNRRSNSIPTNDIISGWSQESTHHDTFRPCADHVLGPQDGGYDPDAHKRLTVYRKVLTPLETVIVNLDPSPDPSVLTLGFLIPGVVSTEDTVFSKILRPLGSGAVQYQISPATSLGGGRSLIDIWLFDRLEPAGGGSISPIPDRNDSGLSCFSSADPVTATGLGDLFNPNQWPGYTMEATYGSGYGSGITPVYWLETDYFMGDWFVFSMVVS